MRNEDQKYAWAHFAAAAYAGQRRAGPAALEADKLLEEYNKRFGPCEVCKGRGRVEKEECLRCLGTGERTP